jgi:hypothetical protein
VHREGAGADEHVIPDLDARSATRRQIGGTD